MKNAPPLQAGHRRNSFGARLRDADRYSFVWVGPDLLPGFPGTLLWSWFLVISPFSSLPLSVSGFAARCIDGAACALGPAAGPVVGPDLLPGRPCTPGFETPPLPGWFCCWLVCVWAKDGA